MEIDFTCIMCIADINIVEALEQCLTDLSLPEVFVQPAKQMSLIDHQGFLGLRPVTKLEENRAFVYRIYIPSKYEVGLMRRIIETTDLQMGGRGSIMAQHVKLRRGTPLVFDTEKLEKLCGTTDKLNPEDHALVICTVPRGGGESLARAVLELGICVPVIFYGAGLGLRDKLGLMRITIPVEKEIIWFIVPRSDAELVEQTLIPRARLDIPGQGFLYKCYVHAPVVNLRVRHGKRFHVATMEQVIVAIDGVHGSSDWRRFGSRKQEPLRSKHKAESSMGFFFIGEEEEIEVLRKTAMENGARGATLNELEMRSYRGFTQDGAMEGAPPHSKLESHSRQLCDIIVSNTVEEKIQEALSPTGLFENGKTCVSKTFVVDMPAVLRRDAVSVNQSLENLTKS